MKIENRGKRAIGVIGISAVAAAIIVGGPGLAVSANAQTVHATFDVSCTQGYVNGGDPFAVGVEVDLILPDIIRAGDTVYPEVVVDLLLPAEVAAAILDNGYESMEGFVNVTVEIVAPDNTSNPLTASNFPLPLTTVPDPAAPFGMVISPSFPAFTIGPAGSYVIEVQGSAVTITGVTVSEAGGGTSTLGDFSCAVDGTIEIGAIDVQEPSETTPPAPAQPSRPALPVVSG